MNPEAIKFIVAATEAGFRDLCNVVATNGGFQADAIVSGEPCRVFCVGTVDGLRWSAHIDSIGQTTAPGDSATWARDSADELIAIHHPESRVCFAFDAIREIVTRHVDYSTATEEQAKAAEAALTALESAFGSC